MLSREELREIRRIEILTKRQVNDQMAGSYHSVFKGQGMNFSDVRLYQPGDDIRRIDWNVSARATETHVKEFVEERELTVTILVDMSGSLDFGTGEDTKRKTAAKLAALMAFSAIKNNDRVGLILFTNQVEKYIPHKKGRKHVLRLIREILAFEPAARETDVAHALEFLSYVSKRKSVAFLISDFLSPPFDRALKVASRRHDLIPIILRDRFEDQLPSLGLVRMVDSETGREVAVPLFSKRYRERFRASRLAQRRALKDLFARCNVEAIRVDGSQPLVKPVLDYFRLRARRSG